MSTPRMFGLETEFAFAAFHRGGARVDSIGAVQKLMELARRRLKSLPGKSSAGMFLGNGSRLYVDCKKPEFTTPECTNPWDACRYGLACEKILGDLADQYARETPDVQEAVISNVNVSYGSWASTWASHESYGHRSDPTIFPEQLIPHLVTRLIYTGAGGFDNRSPGIDFLLSPRVAHLVREVSGDSTSNRGIFHTKNETLAGRGHNRLHLLCGESVCSITARWLRVATTALIVSLIEAGRSPGHAVRLMHPLAAMQVFAADADLRAVAELTSGGWRTALEIQRHYLGEARRHQHAAFMPDWTPTACDYWERTLDRLTDGPAAVSQNLDWAIKLALYQQHAAERGLDWDRLPEWTAVIRHFTAELNKQVAEGLPPPQLIRAVHQDPLPANLAAMQPKLDEHGFDWDGLRHVLQVRQELFELDTRFGQVNGSGIFTALDAAGVLDHRMPGVDNIEHAIDHPPADGRAKLRGETIRKFSGQTGYFAEWSGVWDTSRHKYLDLSDPFIAEEVWRDEAELLAQPNPAVAQAAATLATILRSYDRGDYEGAAERLAPMTLIRPLLRPADRQNFLRYSAWVQARRGHLDGLARLDELAREHAMNMSLICDYVSVLRYRGLVPPPEIQPWIDRGLPLIEARPDADPGASACFLGHVAHTLTRWGRAEEALDVLAKAWTANRYESTHPHTQSRLHAERGEALRMRGRAAEAQQALQEAERIHVENAFDGDLSDFTLTYEAKLCGRGEPSRGFDLLEQARRIQVSLRNRLGEARTLLLQARLPRRMWFSRKSAFLERTLQRLNELKRDCPALAQCPRLRTILERWTDWTNAVMPEGETDFYWKL